MKNILLYLLVGILVLLLGKIVLSMVVGTITFGIHLAQMLLPIIIVGAGVVFVMRKLK